MHCRRLLRGEAGSLRHVPADSLQQVQGCGSMEVGLQGHGCGGDPVRTCGERDARMRRNRAAPVCWRAKERERVCGHCADGLAMLVWPWCVTTSSPLHSQGAANRHISCTITPTQLTPVAIKHEVGPATPGLVITYHLDFSRQELSQRLQRDYILLSHIPSCCTVFDMKG